MVFFHFCKLFRNIFFTEHLRWLLLSILKPLDSQRQWCKWISVLLTVLLISTLLVLVGIFVFIFGKHKLSIASRRRRLLEHYIYYTFFWQWRIEISWYLDQPISFCANFYRNNHRITSILLGLGSIGLMKMEIYRVWVVMWPSDRCVT